MNETLLRKLPLISFAGSSLAERAYLLRRYIMMIYSRKYVDKRMTMARNSEKPATETRKNQSLGKRKDLKSGLIQLTNKISTSYIYMPCGHAKRNPKAMENQYPARANSIIIQRGLWDRRMKTRKLTAYAVCAFTSSQL